jgi:hypothetical protein
MNGDAAAARPVSVCKQGNGLTVLCHSHKLIAHILFLTAFEITDSAFLWSQQHLKQSGAASVGF